MVDTKLNIQKPIRLYDDRSKCPGYIYIDKILYQSGEFILCNPYSDQIYRDDQSTYNYEHPILIHESGVVENSELNSWVAENYSENKPCPFCGSDEDPVQTNSRSFTGRRTEYDYYLECETCELLIGYDIGTNYHDNQMRELYGDVQCKFSTKQEALNFWNNRVKNE